MEVATKFVTRDAPKLIVWDTARIDASTGWLSSVKVKSRMKITRNARAVDRLV